MMPLFKVTLPANAGMFFAQMMQIAAFEVVDIKPLLDGLFGLDPSEPLNANFEAVGLESIYLLHNMGTICLVFVVYFFAVLLSYGLKMSSNDRIKHQGSNL